VANSNRNTTQIDNEAFPGHLVFAPENLASNALQAYRQSAWDLAKELSFPAKKAEDWRWVDLSELDFRELRQPNGSLKASTPAIDQVKALKQGEKVYLGSLLVSPAGFNAANRS